ncbi:DNA cytosine methyltransferase [Streptomyces sp. JJ66]|uniref:DNA cytosine methyltransferase n=1 Tax=Streptomyces sp. JJ66 TaxID=2803843 RepID=UPI001C56A432|nr:DNA cytosine methyltransferase [Streptomyces sp. JJ66]MBW1603430.1 DNA cytosine methyltransferase [Streptomyces sp. JJ66]
MSAYRHDSDLTFTDLFCGAGGSSTGLVETGYTLRLAANHDPVSIRTHAANHSGAEHLIADINALDKRRLPRTRILWGSPICTEISPSGGRRRTRGQAAFDLDGSGEDGQARQETFERTRATALDIIAAVLPPLPGRLQGPARSGRAGLPLPVPDAGPAPNPRHPGPHRAVPPPAGRARRRRGDDPMTDPTTRPDDDSWAPSRPPAAHRRTGRGALTPQQQALAEDLHVRALALRAASEDGMPIREAVALAAVQLGVEPSQSITEGTVG